MSDSHTATLQRMEVSQRDTSPDAGIASIWGILYLLMIFGIFVTQQQAWLITTVLAAIFGGGAMLSWRTLKRWVHLICSARAGDEGKLPDQKHAF